MGWDRRNKSGGNKRSSSQKRTLPTFLIITILLLGLLTTPWGSQMAKAATYPYLDINVTYTPPTPSFPGTWTINSEVITDASDDLSEYIGKDLDEIIDIEPTLTVGSGSEPMSLGAYLSRVAVVGYLDGASIESSNMKYLIGTLTYEGITSDFFTINGVKHVEIDYYQDGRTTMDRWSTSPFMWNTFYGEAVVDVMLYPISYLDLETHSAYPFVYPFIIVVTYLYEDDGVTKNTATSANFARDKLADVPGFSDVNSGSIPCGIFYVERIGALFIVGHTKSDLITGTKGLGSIKDSLTALLQGKITVEKVAPVDTIFGPIYVKPGKPPTGEVPTIHRIEVDRTGTVQIRDTGIVAPVISPITWINILTIAGQFAEILSYSLLAERAGSVADTFEYVLSYVPDYEILFEDDFEDGYVWDEWGLLPGTSSAGVSVEYYDGSYRLALKDDSAITFPEVAPIGSELWQHYTVSLDVIAYQGKDFWDETTNTLYPDNWITFCNAPKAGYYLTLTSYKIENSLDNDYLGVVLIKAIDTNNDDVYDKHVGVAEKWIQGSSTDTSNPLYKYRNNLPLNIKVGVELLGDSAIINIYIDGNLVISYKDVESVDNPVPTGGKLSLGVYYSGHSDASSTKWYYDNVVVTKGCLFNDQFEDETFSKNAWSPDPEDSFIIVNGALKQDAWENIYSTINVDFPPNIVFEADVMITSEYLTSCTRTGITFTWSDDPDDEIFVYLGRKSGVDGLHIVIDDDEDPFELSIPVDDLYDTWHHLKIVLPATSEYVGSWDAIKMSVYLDGRLVYDPNKYTYYGSRRSDTSHLTVKLFTLDALAYWDNIYIESVPEDFYPPHNTKITSPSDGDYVKGVITVKASVGDNKGINSTLLYLNDTLVAMGDYNSETGTATFTLNTTRFTDGEYTLTVVAYDNAGNSNWDEVTVTIDNYDLYIFEGYTTEYRTILTFPVSSDATKVEIEYVGDSSAPDTLYMRVWDPDELVAPADWGFIDMYPEGTLMFTSPQEGTWTIAVFDYSDSYNHYYKIVVRVYH